MRISRSHDDFALLRAPRAAFAALKSYYIRPALSIPGLWFDAVIALSRIFQEIYPPFYFSSTKKSEREIFVLKHQANVTFTPKRVSYSEAIVNILNNSPGEKANRLETFCVLFFFCVQNCDTYNCSLLQTPHIAIKSETHAV